MLSFINKTVSVDKTFAFQAVVKDVRIMVSKPMPQNQPINVKNRTMFAGDNIEVLRGVNSDSIDLIYLDPPFNKNKVFTAPIGSTAEGAEFSDIFREQDIKDEWVSDIKNDREELSALLSGIKEASSKYNYCYCVYMAVRLVEIYRILKPTGSIYLHCDSTMSHYLKLILDAIFGEKNFHNEIIWQRNSSRGKGSQYKNRKFGANTDTILFYTKTDDYYFDPLEKPTQDGMDEKFDKQDEQGRFYNTTTPIFRAKSMGPRPNLCFEWRGFQNPHPSGWRLSKDRLEEEYQNGNIVITKDGKLERRKYADGYEGTPLDNNWTDIARLTGGAKEARGYPTQKPVALLERIIRSSTKKGDVVLDPFCGCATACVAAERLERNWIGIDISHKAYELVKLRLHEEVPQDLFRGEPEFKTTPPKRTDDGANGVVHGYVYIISNKAFPRQLKVGIARDPAARLNNYQTSDPKRGYKLEKSLQTPHNAKIEQMVHSHYGSPNEWIATDKVNEVFDLIQKYDTELGNKP